MEIIRGERQGVPFYFCPDSAWSGAAHGFSTRLGGVSPPPWDSLNLGAARGDAPERVAENFRRFCAAVGADPGALVKNHQVHSSRVRRVTRADILSDPAAPGMFEADGLVTDQPGVCLTIFSGDCIPVLLYDPVRQAVGAAHAGWRGTAGGVAARAAEEMIRGGWGKARVCRPIRLFFIGPSSLEQAGNQTYQDRCAYSIYQHRPRNGKQLGPDAHYKTLPLKFHSRGYYGIGKPCDGYDAPCPGPGADLIIDPQSRQGCPQKYHHHSCKGGQIFFTQAQRALAPSPHRLADAADDSPGYKGPQALA